MRRAIYFCTMFTIFFLHSTPLHNVCVFFRVERPGSGSPSLNMSRSSAQSRNLCCAQTETTGKMHTPQSFGSRCISSPIELSCGFPFLLQVSLFLRACGAQGEPPQHTKEANSIKPEHTTAHCSTLQHTIALVTTPKCMRADGSTAHHVTASHSELWQKTTHCSTIEHTTTIQHKTTHQSTLHRSTVHQMLCRVVLFCVVLCCVALCCVALRCVALRCVALCCVVLCCVVLCCVVLCCVVLCCAEGAVTKGQKAGMSTHGYR